MCCSYEWAIIVTAITRFIESIDLDVLRVERASKIQKCVDTAFDC